MLVIGQFKRRVIGTVNLSYLRKWTERVMCARCCLAFADLTVVFNVKVESLSKMF